MTRVDPDVISEDEISALGERGYFLRDGFLGPAQVEQALTAAEGLWAERAFHRAGISRGADHRLRPEIRGDQIAWIEPDAPAPFPQLRERFEALGEALNRQAYLGLGRLELQLARYPGEGEGYARHRDAFPGPGNRRLTAIVYLNRGWTEASGGQLRLHLASGSFDVEPRADRLLVFLSEQVEHEVLPVYASRWALTGWFRGP